MSKKIKLIIASLIILVLISINISYAINTIDTPSFFETDKTEISPGETLEMTLDLSKIDYNEFNFVLNSNIEIKDIYPDEGTIEKNEIVLSEENDDIIISINKEKLNLNKIILYYQIPDNMELETKIQLNAQILVTEEDEAKAVEEKQIEIKIVEELTEDEEKNNEKTQEKEENKNEDVQNQEENKKEETKNQEENKNNEMQNQEESVNKVIQTDNTTSLQSVSSSEKTSATTRSRNSNI